MTLGGGMSDAPAAPAIPERQLHHLQKWFSQTGKYASDACPMCLGGGCTGRMSSVLCLLCPLRMEPQQPSDSSTAKSEQVHPFLYLQFPLVVPTLSSSSIPQTCSSLSSLLPLSLSIPLPPSHHHGLVALSQVLLPKQESHFRGF